MKKTYISVILAAVILLGGCSKLGGKSATLVERTYEGQLDTISVISIYGNEKLLDTAETILNDIDTRFSVFDESSEISKYNAAGGKGEYSADLSALIEEADEIRDDTEGAFNPHILRIANLWKIGSGSEKVPSAAAIALHLPLPSGANIDLGGIAKGYACKKIAESLTEGGVTSGIINLGGDVFAIGKKADGSLWTVGIKVPLPDDAGHFATVGAQDCAVVTSGIYERYFEKNGKLYHHIFDPKTGFPVENDLLSVTVIGKDPVLCDAYSTACFVMGAEKGAEFIKGKDGYEAVFVSGDFSADAGFKVSATKDNLITITDERFSF